MGIERVNLEIRWVSLFWNKVVFELHVTFIGNGYLEVRGLWGKLQHSATFQILFSM